MNNFEINIELKVKNIFGGGGFKARMNMFQTKSKNSSEIKHSVISTGISIKDRQNLFNNSNQLSNLKKSVTVDISNIKFNPTNQKKEQNNNNIDNAIKNTEIEIPKEKNTNINKEKNKEEKKL